MADDCFLLKYQECLFNPAASFITGYSSLLRADLDTFPTPGGVKSINDDDNDEDDDEDEDDQHCCMAVHRDVGFETEDSDLLQGRSVYSP